MYGNKTTVLYLSWRKCVYTTSVTHNNRRGLKFTKTNTKRLFFCHKTTVLSCYRRINCHTMTVFNHRCVSILSSKTRQNCRVLASWKYRLMYLIKTSERFPQFDRILFPDNDDIQMKCKKREESEKKPLACKESFLPTKTKTKMVIWTWRRWCCFWEMRGKLRYFNGERKP